MIKKQNYCGTPGNWQCNPCKNNIPFTWLYSGIPIHTSNKRGMINVIWFDAALGNWDSGLLSQIFDSRPDLFTQHNTKEQLIFESAIVIIVGKPDVKQTYEYLNNFKYGLAILTSDEDSYFDYKKAIPSQFETWTQYYAPNKQDIETRILVGAPSRIKEYVTDPLPKKYQWSFVGQCQNPSRQKCIEVLKTLPYGYLHIAEGFAGTLGNEMQYQNYLDIMRQSEFIICPSGSMCADSFRVYEAMECGAIPIVEKRSPRDEKDFDYWQEVFDINDLIIVDQWKDLREMMQVFKGTESNAEKKNAWWGFYKELLTEKLIEYAK